MHSNLSYEEIISIQRKVDIVDIVKDYVTLTQKGKNYWGICPFHDDHSPSMSVSPDKQIYKCFVCGNSGNVFNFVMEYEKISFIQAVSKIAHKVGISINVDTNKNKVIDNSNKKLYEIYDIAYKFYQNNLNTAYGKEAKKYLKDRNINDEIIKDFNIGLSLNDSELCSILKKKGYTDDEIIESGVALKSSNNIYDIYKNRIMFPLYDLEGKVNGFSGRIYTKSDESKYINTKETKIFKKGELLYNYHVAKSIARKEKNIIIVEGFMDVIRLNSIGIKNVIATMGTAVTKYQASLISKLAPTITLMFDGDEAGNKATINYLENFGSNYNIKIVRLEDDLDPDEYILKNGKEKMEYHLSHPLDIYDYKLNYYLKDLDLNDSKDISKYIKILIPEIKNIEDEIERDIQINKLCKITGVSKEIILSNLDDIDKKIKPIKIEDKTSRQTKYEKASKYIIYRMIHDNNMILYYFNNLSYLPDNNYKHLANEIVLFYKKYDSFNINDFIIYLSDKKELINLIIMIDDLVYTDDELNDDIDNYFKVIKEYLYKREKDKLKEDLKKETDEMKRKEIARKIVELKMKESL